jgi:hypothetical protein
MSWQIALNRYVQAKNQALTELDVSPLVSVLESSGYLQQEAVRLKRLRLSYRDRNALLNGGEIRLRIIRTDEREGHVTAYITLEQKLRYRIKEQEHTEIILQNERVSFLENRGSWRITEIISEQEPAPSRISRPYGGPQESHSSIHPSVPYLNYSMLKYTGAIPRKIFYDRARAAQYADAWWNSYNPRYIEFAVDCTSYVSQCLFAGGAPMHYTGKRGTGWWYHGKQNGSEQWSYSWAVAQALHNYLNHSWVGLQGRAVSSAAELEIGDVISYDWNGDGVYQHNTIVTAKDANGMPLVNAHTINSYHRYWEYRDSYAWTPQTKYVLVRVSDEMTMP